MKQPIQRVILIVMDSVGIGKAHDADKFGDEGSNTLGHIASWAKKNKVDFALPNLSKLGLGRLLSEYKSDAPYMGSSARLSEISAGKDTTTGHWEIAGTPLSEPFSFYPNGFSSELVEEWIKKAKLPGVLGNCVGSGTAIIDKYAQEHMDTGKPILYTSSDSVFQVAAHEKTFGLKKLYAACEIARKLTLPLKIGRVIARPFIGSDSKFKRVSAHRKDFSLEPPKPNMLDLIAKKYPVASVGKIDDIFCHRSIEFKNHTGNNVDSGKAVIKFLSTVKEGLIFANFIDFDQEWGHRRDPLGYLNCLKEFDLYLDKLIPKLKAHDLLVITADHGNDPTYRGSDHTRENIPLLVYSPNKMFKALNLGEARSFCHIAKLILEALSIEPKKMPALETCESFYNQIISKELTK